MYNETLSDILVDIFDQYLEHNGTCIYSTPENPLRPGDMWCRFKDEPCMYSGSLMSDCIEDLIFMEKNEQWPFVLDFTIKENSLVLHIKTPISIEDFNKFITHLSTIVNSDIIWLEEEYGLKVRITLFRG